MWYLGAFALTLLTVAVVLYRRRQAGQSEPAAPVEHFLIKPYLQLGDGPQSDERQSMEVVWHSRTDADHWELLYKSASIYELRSPWLKAAPAHRSYVGAENVAGSFRYVARLDGLAAGTHFHYRVLCNGVEVFAAVCRSSRKARGQNFRFVLFGDLADGGNACRKIAFRSYLERPDVVIMPGDIVYKRGSVAEYLERYFPVFNSNVASPELGAPILRSVLTMAAVGNHDVGMNNPEDIPDLDDHPDLMGFFQFWSLPSNGPVSADSKKNVPDLRGTPQRKEALLRSAGWRYPRMANYSFDFGDTHWLVLDANAYMDWTDPHLLAWVEKDLAESTAKWKMVSYHQPAFTTDVKHADEQHMRLLCALFEKYGVDVVFSGHNHTYERNFPLRFKVQPQPDGSPKDRRGRVKGTFEFDKEFDGVRNTKAHGVLYIVSGGGGAKLYLTPERRADHNALPPYTCKLVDDVHSFTVCDVEPAKLTFRQLSDEGVEVDRFTLTK